MSSSGKPARRAAAGRRSTPGHARGLFILVYSVAVYIFSLLVFGYAVAFLAGHGVPRSIDAGPHSSWPLAVAIDALAVLLFAVQHSVMARPWFKHRWARVVPAAAERATFVLSASLVLALLFWSWRPIGGVVWRVPSPGAWVLAAGYAAGWILTVGSTFLISHLDLFGLRQAYVHARGAAYQPVPFTERGLYGRLRHPLMAGFIVVFWAAPTMTAGHLLFAAAATGYILLGIIFEERDLRGSLGVAYISYTARVPALIPALPLRARQSSGRDAGTA
jgi:protein-S-isoprenylcysteine O-methyltransferase Ste14